jgi:hypothetical protein
MSARFSSTLTIADLRARLAGFTVLDESRIVSVEIGDNGVARLCVREGAVDTHIAIVGGKVEER